MRNIRLTVSYDGTDFFGWQRQPNVPTIQGAIEAAIEKTMGEPVSLTGSGRTDAGVHALNQTANFRTEGSIPCEKLVTALNNCLPSAVKIKKAEDVPWSFHARYHARAKTYRYRILCAPIPSPFIARFVYHHIYPLDRRKMAEAAQLLEGEHDFKSFAAVGEDDNRNPESVIRNQESGIREPEVGLFSRTREASTVRTIFSSRIVWRPRTSILAYDVRGSGFLHHMVRNIVGTLLEVGSGKIEPRHILTILDARDRTKAGPTAPASGLCLMSVEY